MRKIKKERSTILIISVWATTSFFCEWVKVQNTNEFTILNITLIMDLFLFMDSHVFIFLAQALVIITITVYT